MTKRILSIDGGGIRGILPLALLTEIEARRDRADLFDMVAGTSIGCIIATGLAHRVSAKTIYDMLMSDGGTIFAKTLVTDVLNAVNPKIRCRAVGRFPRADLRPRDARWHRQARIARANG